MLHFMIYKAVCHASLRLFVDDTNLFISGKCIGDIVYEVTLVRRMLWLLSVWFLSNTELD